ncbi:MAG: DNA (cytosine-5-)-methyltransferase [Chloroflexi bacterium]|jgi:DNA (cytosine-5)-methyltransferase 1|nr:DNA (cytosine-5-)-methyltransferase [Chloroflexota bacterium]
MKDQALNLTVAEYFAGIGLVRMGLEPCGWRVDFANDISEKKYEMYKVFFPNGQHYVIKDIFDVDPSNVPSTTLATCSFPCIDLSLAGNMNGIDGDHSSAFWGFIRILKAQGESAPPLVLIENVPGWLYSNNGMDFRVTIQALNKLGYACDIFSLNALSFTPQSRLRIFVVGAKFPDLNKDIDQTLSRPKTLLTKRLRKSIFTNLDLNWFYTEAPKPPPSRTKGLSNIVERMDDTDSRWWSEDKVKHHLDMMAKSHYERVARFIEEDQITYRTFYRRTRKGQQRAEVRHDDLAGCLRTAIGGSGKQFLIRAGNGNIKMRAMTAREYARLQGVPDKYPITTNGVQALTGFGDAVCVPVITWLAQNALKPLIEKHLSVAYPVCQNV